MAEEQKIMEHLKINQLATKPKTKKAFGVMGKDFVYIVHRFVDLYDIEDVVDKISNTKLRYMSNEAVYKDDEYSNQYELKVKGKEGFGITIRYDTYKKDLSKYYIRYVNITNNTGLSW